MYKRICFLYTETTGLHQTQEDVNKKKLFCYARMVTLNYEIGYYKDGEFVQEKKVRQIVKPRCMNIPEETIAYHGITQKRANKNGIDPEELILAFKNDIKFVDIIVSHNVDFHFKTILAEALRYNILLDLNNYIVIDTISFFHNYGFIKLKDLAEKLSIKNIQEKSKYNVDLIRDIFLKLYTNFEASIKTS